MKLKFCGLTRKADIEAANETKPDFIGFVFAESRRHVSDMDAARLKEHLDPEIKTVGVFVNDEPEHIAALVRDEVIDIIQLHGGESVHYIEKLRKLTKRAHSSTPSAWKRTATLSRRTPCRWTGCCWIPM